MVEGREETGAIHGGEAAVGGKDNVPAGVAGHHASEHLLVALVGAVADAHAVLLLEAGKHGGIDIGGPVVDVEARALIERAGSERSGSDHKRTAIHFSCNLWESRIKAPKATTIKADTAFTTGLTPRRAMA